jgi:hypothetical protein
LYNKYEKSPNVIICEYGKKKLCSLFCYYLLPLIKKGMVGYVVFEPRIFRNMINLVTWVCLYLVPLIAIFVYFQRAQPLYLFTFL